MEKWRQGDFVDYTLVDLGEIFFSKSMSSKNEEIKESGADLDGGDCDVEGEISDTKDGVSLVTR